MKAQRSRARVSAKRAVPTSVQSPARPLLVFPGEASSQTIPNGNGKVSRALKNAQEQISRGWGNAGRLLSCAWKGAKELVVRSWKSIRAQQIAKSSSKRLRVSATVSLGEKRFVAVIQVDGSEFLVGGGATNVALLAQLDAKKSFEGVLTDTMNAPEAAISKKQPAKRVRKKMVTAVEQAGEEA